MVTNTEYELSQRVTKIETILTQMQKMQQEDSEAIHALLKQAQYRAGRNAALLGVFGVITGAVGVKISTFFDRLFS